MQSKKKVLQKLHDRTAEDTENIAACEERVEHSLHLQVVTMFDANVEKVGSDPPHHWTNHRPVQHTTNHKHLHNKHAWLFSAITKAILGTVNGINLT